MCSGACGRDWGERDSTAETAHARSKFSFASRGSSATSVRSHSFHPVFSAATRTQRKISQSWRESDVHSRQNHFPLHFVRRGGGRSSLIVLENPFRVSNNPFLLKTAGSGRQTDWTGGDAVFPVPPPPRRLTLYHLHPSRHPPDFRFPPWTGPPCPSASNWRSSRRSLNAPTRTRARKVLEA